MSSFVQVSVCKLCNNYVVKNQHHACLSSNDLVEQPLTRNISTTTKITKELQNTKVIDIYDDENDDDDFEEFNKVGEFCKEDYSRLIEFIEPCRPIRDHKMKLSVRSDNIKDRFWNQVFVQFKGKYTMSTIKKSWSYLRQKYTREKKLRPSGSEGKKKQWIHLKHLTFLDNMIENNKRTSCNLANNDTIFSADSDLIEKNPKRKQSELMGESLNVTRELLKELKESRPIPPVKPNTELNENDIFFKYLSVRMNGLPKEIITKLHDEFLSAVKRGHSMLNF